MRVYATCMTGLEDVWISRMDGALHLEDTQRARQDSGRTGEKEKTAMSAHDRQVTPARLGAYWAWNLSEGGVRCRLLAEPAFGLGEVTPAEEGYAAGTKKRPQ
jgi:hypothetical protein